MTPARKDTQRASNSLISTRVNIASPNDPMAMAYRSTRRVFLSIDMAATSNSGQVLADLRSMAMGFGFLATIEGKTLGDDLAVIVADSIHARSVDRESGADGQWPANAPEYAAWKAKKYGVDKPNVRTGQMLSLESLLGQTVVTTDHVQMLYGTGHAATRSATGMGFDPERDGLTDVEKAYFCSTSRPFYELDDEIADRVFDRIEQCLEDYLKQW